MQDGQVKQSGNYEDHLLTAGTAFERLVNAHKEVITGLEPSPSENKSELRKTVNIHQSLEDINKSEGKLINGLPGVQLTEEEEEKAVDIVEWKPFVVISEGLWFSVSCVLSQATSSDISVIDFDMPFSFAYVIASSDMASSHCSHLRSCSYKICSGERIGQKVAVCGSLGSGKSSMLYAILGEISRTSGTVSSQIHMDLTEIGQRGLNMSGGQKQRIQLARAVYNDADIYLRDHPFSAVDAHTAATLFNDCVMTSLEKKTVILVTHHLEFLSSVDTILVTQDGQVKQSGNYEDLLTAGTAFEQLVNAHKEVITGLDPSPSENKAELQKNKQKAVDKMLEWKTVLGLPLSQKE
ncbi:ABC transporter C family member 8-like protein isoform X1 [Tanacetum coccineum]